MPTLLEQCERVRDGLDRAHLANKTRLELATLQKRAQEWSQRKARQAVLRERLGLLEADPQAVEDARGANAEVALLVAQVRQRLAEDGVQALSQNGLWLNLLNAADGANEKAAYAVRQAWRALISLLGEVASPANLGAFVPKTQANAAALEDYRRAYAVYENLVRQDMPVDAVAVQALRDAVANLQAARSRLTVSAPEEVRRFLEAVGAGGAALPLLTSGVLHWLSEHDDIGRFYIKARPSST